MRSRPQTPRDADTSSSSIPHGAAAMQLDRVPPPAHPRVQDFGSRVPSIGVNLIAENQDGLPGSPRPARARPISWRGVWTVLAGALLLLGQGERYRVDPQLVTPERTIASFWRALRHDDDVAAAKCMVEGDHNLPFPGMLWFLPPTTDFRLSNFKIVPVEGGHALVTYVVRYTPVGVPSEQAFVTSFEMVRQRGEWRIVRPVGEASMPEWKPIPRAVDI